MEGFISIPYNFKGSCSTKISGHLKNVIEQHLRQKKSDNLNGNEMKNQ